MSAPLRLGTRGSQLALWQAGAVAAALARQGGPGCELVVIRTSGDRFADTPIDRAGGKRVFVKEIEDALLRGEIDLAVHSAKDMPADLPEALALGAVLPREEPWDALVLPSSAVAPAAGASLCDALGGLGRTPCVGTGSARRIAQLRRLMPGARFAPIRGNVGTRLGKLDAGEYDVLVLAAAGLRRLGFAGRVSTLLPGSACVPAPGQGVVAIEIRAHDDRMRQIVSPVNDGAAWAALEAERTLVARLGGGCQVPIGALASPGDGTLELHAIVTSLDGARALRCEDHGPDADPAALGRRVAERLLADGAGDLLEEVRLAHVRAHGAP